MDHAGAVGTRERNERVGTCPHIDRNDARCATRFSLGRIRQAFEVCFGAFHGCPMYHRINRELPVAGRPERPTVEVTISCGEPRHARPVPLRATGT
jgi:hypothetical protein